MHSTALLTVLDISDAVHDNPVWSQNNSLLKEKYHIWNRSLTYNYDFGVSHNKHAINNKGNATIFGVDGEQLMLNGGNSFVPTIFGGCLRENFRYSINSHSNSSIGGVKLSWFNEDCGNLSMILSCGAVRTGNSDCVLRSSAFSVSSRYINSLPLKENISVVPMVQFDYSHITSKDAKTKNILVNQGNFYSLRASAGLNLQLESGDFRASVGAKFHKRFGENVSKTFEGVNVHSLEKISRSNVELSAKISGKISDGITVDLAVGKSFGGRNGASLNLTLSAAL
jgi:hypothetical protein